MRESVPAARLASSLTPIFFRSIRLWSLTTGEAVHVLYGHDSFIYSLSPIPDSAGGGLISGGEDRTMRVWRGALR